MTPAEFDRWVLLPVHFGDRFANQPGIKRDGRAGDIAAWRKVRGTILTRVRTLLWLVTLAALLASALAVGASAAASVIERRTEIGLMKALGAGFLRWWACCWRQSSCSLRLSAEESATRWCILLARLLGEKSIRVHAGPKLFLLFIGAGARIVDHAARKRISTAPRFAI